MLCGEKNRFPPESLSTRYRSKAKALLPATRAATSDSDAPGAVSRVNEELDTRTTSGAGSAVGVGAGPDVGAGALLLGWGLPAPIRWWQ